MGILKLIGLLCVLSQCGESIRGAVAVSNNESPQRLSLANFSTTAAAATTAPGYENSGGGGNGNNGSSVTVDVNKSPIAKEISVLTGLAESATTLESLEKIFNDTILASSLDENDNATTDWAATATLAAFNQLAREINNLIQTTYEKRKITFISICTLVGLCVLFLCLLIIFLIKRCCIRKEIKKRVKYSVAPLV